jgi:hypothetical protein
VTLRSLQQLALGRSPVCETAEEGPHATSDDDTHCSG